MVEAARFDRFILRITLAVRLVWPLALPMSQDRAGLHADQCRTALWCLQPVDTALGRPRHGIQHLARIGSTEIAGHASRAHPWTASTAPRSTSRRLDRAVETGTRSIRQSSAHVPASTPHGASMPPPIHDVTGVRGDRATLPELSKKSAADAPRHASRGVERSSAARYDAPTAPPRTRGRDAKGILARRRAWCA